MSAASLGAVRRARPARVLQVMGFGVAFLFAAAHLTGGLAPGSRSSVPDDWHAETGGRFAVTTPSGATRTHGFASDAELRTPKVIRSVVAPAPRSPSSPRSPPNPNPNAPPPFPPSEHVMSSSEHAGSAEHAGSEHANVGASHEDRGVDEFDARVAARRAAERFRATCGAADAFFAAAGARYAPGSLRRDPSLGVLIIDWSENHFNGIGDEMQHYQEMLAIGLGTGRAAYLQTQPRACRGTGLGGSPAPPSVAHVVEACRFDLGDFFTGIRGVDWRWDGEKERKVADELGVAPEAARADELVVTWSPKGMYYRTGRDGVAEGEAESPDGTYVAPPDANSIEVMMNDPVVRGARVVRIRIKQSFGHWCHPHQRGDWGMCASYRWIVGVRMTNDGNRSAEASGSSEPSPCPSCAVGGCFGAAIAHPRDFLKRQMAPYLREMERGNWTAAVAAHVRVGFADVSAVAPPTRAFSRRENATLAGMDAFLAEEAERVPFPEPECPAADIAKRTGANTRQHEAGPPGSGPDRDGGFAGVPNASAPLSSFLRCAAATGRALASGPDASWGVFLMTDAPGVRAVVFAEAKRLGLPSVLATDGRVRARQGGQHRRLRGGGGGVVRRVRSARRVVAVHGGHGADGLRGRRGDAVPVQVRRRREHARGHSARPARVLPGRAPDALARRAPRRRDGRPRRSAGGRGRGARRNVDAALGPVRARGSAGRAQDQPIRGGERQRRWERANERVIEWSTTRAGYARNARARRCDIVK